MYAESNSTAPPADPPADPETLAGLDESVERAQQFLLAQQRRDGHWCAQLEGDNILESEYALLLYFLGRGDEVKMRRLCAQLREAQLGTGGWAIYHGGPPDPNPSVKSYFALKLAGDDPEAAHMKKARDAIRGCGGVEACNSFTKLYLAVFGQYSWNKAPAVPPELIRLPLWFPINIWEMSSWSRAIVVPLSIVWALKPHCPVPPGRGIDELHTHQRAAEPLYLRRNRRVSTAFWAGFFRVADRVVKAVEALGLLRPLRAGSIARCRSFIEPRLEKSAGLGAIFPSILNVVLAYRALGFELDHPVIASQLKELEELEVSNGDALKVQPCCSPVWDTSLTLAALLDSGLPADHPSFVHATRWLLRREVTEAGDWRMKNPDGSVGGWYFEYANEFYPDCDDTAEILAVLARVHIEDPELEERVRAAVQRALDWQLSMQNDDGGWGAFDKNCDRQLLTLIPFADHNAMIDPSTADITARTIEALRAQALPADHPAIERALRFLRRAQESDGAWYGRWGANYIYGTWLALSALSAVGKRAFGPGASVAAHRGVGWLRGCQNDDGGWGESLASYDRPEERGVGESTATQTAWAIMGLVAAGAAEPESDAAASADAVRRGVAYLLQTQAADGSWCDLHWTGTGFPGVFYLRYHAYSHYFPLQALSIYRRLARE